ncbi:MAG: hypothetical protein Q9216_005859 [Gyalolechia sp. 2 TL-2023]
MEMRTRIDFHTNSSGVVLSVTSYVNWSPSKGEDKTLHDLGFDFEVTEWSELGEIAIHAWGIKYDYQIHLDRMLAARVIDLTKMTTREQSADQPTRLLFLKEIQKLQSKFERHCSLMVHVCDKVSEQAQEIESTSEEEGEADSVFHPGRRILFKHCPLGKNYGILWKNLPRKTQGNTT